MLATFCVSIFNTNIFSYAPLVIKVVIFFFVQGNMQNMIKARVKSLSSSAIQELLGGLKKPVRLASQSPNGFPLISTLWFLYHDDYFWCITQKSTLLRRNLATNQKCAFEIALGGDAKYKVIRGQGNAVLDLSDGERVTNLMIARYISDPDGPVACQLRAQIPTEYAIRITPVWVRGQGWRSQ